MIEPMFFVIIGLLAALGYVAAMAARVLRYSVAAHIAAKVTKPYMRIREHAPQHMLILGDSTMYGAGVEDPERTVGGLLAAKYPRASIETLAINGAKAKNLHKQMDKAQYQQYDLILIGIGGNDIVQMSAYSAVRRELIVALREASKISKQIILCHSVNIGGIGFFLFPLNHFYDHRSRKLSKLYEDIAALFPNVTYLNFYRPLNNDHYDKTTRKKFIAADAFHPNEYANRYFFDLILQGIESSNARLPHKKH
jgi:lysophospholipase L1-like esterase